MNETADTSALNTTSLTLRPLTPEFSEEHHRVYADVIQDALKNPKIKNIALSGPYGVGKSSILESLKSSEYKDETVFISLSTLGKTSPPNDAHAPTHHIQKEIVKQLIYSAKPSDLPDSRFHRIGSTRQDLASILSILIAFPVSTFVNSALATWARGIKGLQPWFPQSVCWTTVIKLAIFSIVAVSIFELIQWAHSRIQVTALSAGPAKLTLANGEESTYFDRYLDEIVYFFTQSGKRIVVFEDIDRFDNTNIFEELHALNTLLNNAPQVVNARHAALWFRSTPKPQTGIRFIYAVKDEIFDSAPIASTPSGGSENPVEEFDAAETEIQRANRTKFFDLIIPVVPFVSHRSARDLLVEELGKEEAAKLGTLANVALHHIPDPRLIRNTCNEYRVYRRMLMPDEDGGQHLEPKQLFALMLYKAVHYADFEKICHNTSNLDIFHSKISEALNTSREALHLAIQEARKRLDNSELSSEGARLYGEKLSSKLFEFQGVDAKRYTIKELHFIGKHYPGNYVYTSDFWQSIHQNKRQYIEFTLSSDGETEDNGLLLHYDEFFELLDLKPLDVDAMLRKIQDDEEAISVSRQGLKFLEGIDFARIFAFSPFSKELQELQTKASQLAKTHLKSKLARSLIIGGFITRDYALYTSIYHESNLTKRAMRFLLHHLRPGEANASYPLTEEEVEQLKNEAEFSYWYNVGACNVYIVHALLIQNKNSEDCQSDQFLEAIRQQLSDYSFIAEGLSKAYLTMPFENHEHFTRWIAPYNPAIFTLLLSQIADWNSLLSLLNAALESADGELNYAHSPELTAFIAENFTNFPALVDEKSNSNPANTYNLIEQLQIPIDNVSPLRSEIRSLALSAGNFTLNPENFSVVVDEAGSPSLDTIIRWNEQVAQKLLNDLDTYFALLGTYSASALEDPPTDTFRFIEQYAPEPSTQLDALLSHSSQAKWRFDRLDEIDQVFWPVLAKFNRLEADASLLLQYIEKVEIDADLARFLESIEEISFSLITEQDKLEKLAIALLTSDSALSDETRITLTKSLSLDKRLSLNSLKPRSGRFLASLLEAKLIEDDAHLVPFAEPLGTNALFEVLAASENFTTYLEPGLLSEEVVCELFESKTIQDKVKQYIAKNFEITLGSDISMKQANKIAAYANSHELKIHADDLKLLALNRASASAIIPLLEPHLPDLDIELLKQILNALPQPYPLLTTPGNRHPKIPGGSGIKALLTTLEKHRLVSSFTPENGDYRVHMTHK